ncbi:alanine/glycine:cation symporter family protein [Aequorivita sp. KMM 9714]|uniref:alanine/glycine:cation symporter family protein n=1 Tax=Aequorivita sp. KMM 9714 TaxID=2707173 RepID=UPI0013EDE002|nr:alanine/glycine:cation symporter family protein [Aequorivita sp. KMM 9714]NGX85227.1 alanine:cation symporter family protein [Aequorivita sp. KMM 9714]
MKKFLLSLITFIIPFFTFAQELSTSERIDLNFKKYTGWFVDGIFYEIPFSESFQIPWVLIVLIGGALYFTIYFKLINITGFYTAVKVVMGKYEDIEKHGVDTLYGDVTPNEQENLIETIRDDSADGEVSHFQALTAALSATVGLGNIAGVAVALSIGGPGATFWMILAGILGMASKFAECTLGVKFRDVGPDGTVYGGPMYYLKKGLAQKGMGGLGKVLAVIFAIFVIGGSFGGGNMFQANQAAAQFVQLFDLQGTSASIWFGIVMAIIVAFVIIGGIKRIAKVTEKIVPFMAGIYVLGALIILIANYNHIGDAFALIFEGAFSGLGIAGGLVGVMIQGIRRGAFSNEAGVGSAAIAHSAVRTKYPASEGIVALLEPFIDTVVICTMTALVIVITNFDNNIIQYGVEVKEGVELTATAFDSVIPHFSIVLTIAVIMFAFSTMISWSYYGMQGWVYLFGRGKVTELVYKLLFCIFIWIGSVISLGSVINFSDAMIFAMVVPNIIGVVILTPVVRKELNRYMKAIKIKHQAIDDGLEDMSKHL